MKRKFYSELAYVLGLVLLAFGTSMLEKASLGMSMVVAPAYLLYLKLSQVLPWFSFGLAGYLFQLLLLVLLFVIVRRFSISYVWSFLTVVLYGLLLDGAMLLLSPLPPIDLPLRIVFFAVGILLNTCGIAFLLHTYILPEVYELFVRDIAAHFHRSFSQIKVIYDCTSLLLSVVLSFAFFGFGHFEGIHVGTAVSAVINGLLIGFFSKQIRRRLVFEDKLPLRSFFEK